MESSEFNETFPHLQAGHTELERNIGKVGYTYLYKDDGTGTWVPTTTKLWWQVYMIQKNFRGELVYRVYELDERGEVIQTPANLFGKPQNPETFNIVGGVDEMLSMNRLN